MPENAAETAENDANDLCRHCLHTHGLWIDPRTAEHAIGRRQRDESVRLIAADARTGISGVHTLASQQLMSAPDAQ